MPRSYASQFRTRVIDQIRCGRPVTAVAAFPGLPTSTVFRWVRQERIDRGEIAGLPTTESAAPRGAKRRTDELEAELATVN
jgi:hypothetical protein